VLQALIKDVGERVPDHLVFSGDATTLAFDAEFARAAKMFPFEEDGPPRIAVPGNHDYYTPRVARSGAFERHFASWQTGRRIGDYTYPFAQQAKGYWLVGVNSAWGSPWAWDASGRVDADQLTRLERLLGELPAGPRVLVTHYPVCLASGKRERMSHGLRNAREVVQVAAKGGVCLWLHGHRHGPYTVNDPKAAPFPIICGGSATQHGRWSYGLYTLIHSRCAIDRRVYREETRTFETVETTELTLPLT
jgi:3',5'-cyclic AMP phosphodiesterase CpdA